MQKILALIVGLMAVGGLTYALRDAPAEEAVQAEPAATASHSPKPNVPDAEVDGTPPITEGSPPEPSAQTVGEAPGEDAGAALDEAAGEVGRRLEVAGKAAAATIGGVLGEMGETLDDSLDAMARDNDGADGTGDLGPEAGHTAQAEDTGEDSSDVGDGPASAPEGVLPDNHTSEPGTSPADRPDSSAETQQAAPDQAEADSKGSDAAPSETADVPDKDELDRLLTVEGFDYDRVIDYVEGADLSPLLKRTTQSTLEGARDNPVLLEAALSILRGQLVQ
ncbi:hypothetical protein GCM10011415_25750 [Salipiger pallidus]|uniref:Uncharacterized protein n=1 Tax=Salipiger pallidus TaxID=1775170 RepID=A0A8J2ZKK7_9RHOB|nr:hypothetical protein [Salipiger pallidus]GGG75964.1 hypothetical protein GCM10011415_25750 [Salipiger pallidus]